MDRFLFHMRQAKDLMKRTTKVDWVKYVNDLADHHSARVQGTDEEKAVAREKMISVAAREMRLPALLETAS